MDKKKLNVLLIVGAVCIVIVAAVLGIRLAGMSDSSNAGNDKDTTVGGDNVSVIEPVTEIDVPDDGIYNIEVKTEGDMFFEEIGVYIYTDNTLEELVWFDKTDENGIAEFNAEDATGYVVVLQDIPEGYEVQEYYYITGAKTEIVLETALKDGIDLSEISYSLGDVVHDFSVTTPDGETYQISELLDEKKAVILNFWYVQCGPCKEEFPYLNEAYAEHKDNIEILAMNPVNLDDEEIAAFKKDMGLDFPMMQCEEEWATAMNITAYPTTVVIDRYGVISLIHKGSLPDAEIFSQLFEYYSSDDYKQIVVEDIYDIVTTELSQGTMDNPFEFGGILDFEVTVRPNQVIYFNMYRVDAMNLKIEDPDSYVIYEDETYYPENGVVGLKVHCPDTYTPAFVGIGNAGTEKKTFHVTLTADPGTYENPYTLKIGEFNVNVSANNEKGVFYEYRATQNGALTLQCLSATKGVKYDYYLQNMRTSENRNLEYDGVADKDGNVTVSVDVEKGDRVLVCISTLPDASGNYPAGNFKMKASLGDASIKDKMYYGVSVVDDSLNAISGVSVKLTCLEIEEIEGLDDTTEEEVMEVGDVVSLTTDSNGVASNKIRIGSYKAVVTVPLGYAADTMEYTLTKDNPNVTFMLDKVITETKTYTVTVFDENGDPVAGAAVAMGGRTVTTNKNGQAVFSLPVGTYEAVVSLDGYVLGTYQFEEGKTELSVNVEKSEDDSSADKVTYTVAVKYDGAITEDIYVQFMSDGAVKAMPLVDKTTKKATVELPKGTYTVELKFGTESILGCYSLDLTLTETERTLEVEIGKAIDASAETTEDAMGYPAYLVSMGANPVINMNVDDYNYFIFQPTESGVYKFSTDNSSAKLTYWGANPYFMWEQTEALGDDYDAANNSFIREVAAGSVKEDGTGASYIVALNGTTSATLIIEKVGEAEEEIAYDVYEAKTPPKAFTYKGGTLTKFDEGEKDSSKYALVLGSDGYYRLASTNKIVYVDLDYSSLSMTDLVATTALRYISYDADGNIVEKVDYTECLTDYVNARDEATGYYPLTEDLKTMIQNGGEHTGWWNPESPNYRFEEGVDINEEIAWLFFCYY